MVKEEPYVKGRWQTKRLFFVSLVNIGHFVEYLKVGSALFEW
jgi:hypothetical protein